MGSIIERIKKLTLWRYLCQLTSTVIISLPFFPAMRQFCVPAFHCHSCPWSMFACPIGVIANFAQVRLFPFITVGILGLVGTFGGRIICGWVCPFGLLQDLLGKITRAKVRIPYVLTYTKYAVLIGLVLLVPYSFPASDYRFCRLCPAGTLESTIPRAFLGEVTTFGFNFFLRIAILAGVLLLAIISTRGFCRTLCPLGAIFSIFNKFSVFRLKVTHPKCHAGCTACAKVCPVQIHPVKQLNDAECIRCLDCTATDHIKLGTG
ncbi:MAG TPA: 4Fe-4S binding protein [Armatimonadota bacterium]|nr:4Fe-4S binding protein [Armatimonadota bacterium]